MARTTTLRNEKMVTNDSSRAQRAYESARDRFGRGDLPGALKACRKALRRAPGSGPVHHLMGLILFNTGDQKQALEHLDRAAGLMPESVEIPIVQGRIHALLGDIRAAWQSFERALEVAPDSVHALNHYGEFMRQHGRPRKAMTLFSRALKLEPRNTETLRFTGNAFLELGQSEQALASFRMALVGDPRNKILHVSMGKLFMDRGEREEAATCYRAALEIDPALAAAHLGLSLVESGAPESGRIEVLRALDRPEMPINDRVDLHFALAETLRRDERHEEAMAEYVVANGLREQITNGPYDLETHVRETSARMENLDREFFAQRAGWGDSTERPVFIVGMPRSGTTLVESILGSHPDCYAAGELKLLGGIRMKVEGLKDRPDYLDMLPERWRALTADHAAAAAQHYLGGLEQQSPDAARVTDKMPHNFKSLWLIALMFPNARVIHCRRDPRDTCVSIFTQVFRSGHAYKNDLRTLGLYYRQYERLMAHWAQALPTPPLDVRYEDLIADQEGVSRRLLAHCGLDWDERCLEFHRQDRSVLTASSLQVKRKVYGSSVGRWKRYGAQLEPLLEALGPIED